MKWETIESFCKKIQMNKKVIIELKHLNKETFLRNLSQIETSLLHPGKAEKAAEKLNEQVKGNHLLELLIHLRTAIKSWKEVYVPLGIPEEIYFDSMKVFSRFMDERMNAYNDYQFDRGFWTWRFTSGMEFRVGILEYEMRKTPFSTGTLEKEDSALAIHIPSDVHFTKERVRKSYSDAYHFFKKYFPDYSFQCAFTDSWLLASSLKGILAPHSNIREFANDFKIIEEHPNRDDALEWVFGRKDLSVEELTENTSIEREVKKRLAKGEQIGAAVGVLHYKGTLYSFLNNPFE